MKCPSCHRPVDYEANSCYSCGYSAHHASAKFGANEVWVKRIHDAADCLRVSESHQIAELFDYLESRFPQIRFACYVGELNEQISISELGFWLLNHGKFDTDGEPRPNQNAILLILDVERKLAGISLGYLTELLLSEDDCMRALMASRPFMVNNDFGDGVLACFRKLGKQLMAKSRQMKGMTMEEKQAYLHQSAPLNSLVLPNHCQGSIFESDEPGIVDPTLPIRTGSRREDLKPQTHDKY